MTNSRKPQLAEAEAPRPELGSTARDAAFDDVIADVGVDVFESRGEVLSVESLRDTWTRFVSQPAFKWLAEAQERMARAGGAPSIDFDADAAGARVDDYGCDMEYLEKLWPFAKWVHDVYFRVESRGIEHVPDDGRVLLVANHSGTLPYDGAMVVTAVRERHPARRLVRPLIEDFVYHFPYLGMFMARVGAVRACQENAERLLNGDQPVLVFPEGVKGIGKLFRKRYQLQRFGRGGAVKLALRTGSPIIPVGIVGAEESMPLLSKVGWLARPLGLPYIPVTPTLPLLGPLGALPYPTKWYIDFGPLIDLSEYGPDAVKDRVLVNRLNEHVRAEVQQLVDVRLRERTSVFRG